MPVMLTKCGTVSLSSSDFFFFPEKALQQIECLSIVSQQSQPDVKWVENAKTLFKVRTHVASTIYAQVQLLPRFFAH